jgi:hypothetical protein
MTAVAPEPETAPPEPKTECPDSSSEPPTTTPAKSRPGIRGTVVWCILPCRFLTSLGLMAAARTRTSTSPAARLGVETSSSCKSSSDPVLWNRKARIIHPLAFFQHFRLAYNTAQKDRALRPRFHVVVEPLSNGMQDFVWIAPPRHAVFKENRSPGRTPRDGPAGYAYLEQRHSIP